MQNSNPIENIFSEIQNIENDTVKDIFLNVFSIGLESIKFYSNESDNIDFENLKFQDKLKAIKVILNIDIDSVVQTLSAKKSCSTPSNSNSIDIREESVDHDTLSFITGESSEPKSVDLVENLDFLNTFINKKLNLN